MDKKYHKNTNGMFYALNGGIISFILYMFILEFLGGRNVEGAILAATITLTVVICFCTGQLLDKLNR
jgi:Na+/melibiose symporter-like transporter